MTSVVSSSQEPLSPITQSLPQTPNINGGRTPLPVSSSTPASPPLLVNGVNSSNGGNVATTSSITTSKLTTLHIEEIQGKNINEKDVFIKFKIDGKKYKTKIHKKTANPYWSDKFTITSTNKLEEITFNVVSQNILGNNVKLGHVKYSLTKNNSTLVNGVIGSRKSTLVTSNTSNGSGFNDMSSIATEGSTPTSPLSMASEGLPPVMIEKLNPTTTDTSTLSDTYDSWTIDYWGAIERERTSSDRTQKSNNAAPILSEIKMKIIVKIRDIYLDTDTNSGTSMSDEAPVPPSKYSPREQPNPKEMSFIGKGGSQIKKFTKKITSKIDSGGGNAVKTDNRSRIGVQQQAAIEEQIAKERQKELEKEAMEKEKERAREKLRQREEEELQKQLDKERQEERRKAKEAKQKKEKEKRYVPTRPVDYFFVVGCSTKLEPIDQRYDISSKVHDPLDVIYKGELFDCFPQKDDEILPNHIWMYCYPKGVQLLTEEQSPSFFPFVLTNEIGTRFYGSCLTFYEPIAEEMSSEIRKRRGSSQQQDGAVGDLDQDNLKSKRISTPPNTLQISTTNNNGSSNSSSSGGANGNSGLGGSINHSISSSSLGGQIYAPKCICFLSHYPFYPFFRICLNEIYQKVFFSTTPLPIERIIYNMVQEVPLPIQGLTNVTFTLNNSILSLKRPSEYLLPFSDLPFSLLFKCLDIKNVLSLFKSVLLEEKIVIISSHYSLLTYITEIISTLIYPFSWPHVYVPILPELLLEYVYSPFPFIMGIHRSYSHNIMNEENLLGEIVVVDLDNNIVLLPPPTDSHQEIALPEKETMMLTNQLRKVVQFEILSSDLPNFNLNTLSPIAPSFSSDSSKRILSNQASSQVYLQPLAPSSHVDDHIRLSFLQFFCNLLSDYRKHLKYLRVFPKPITLFNKGEFIKSRPSNSSLFNTTLIESQAFSFFLDQHNWPTRNLFDYMLESQKYKKPIEELVASYQSAIPQALGVLENHKQTTITSPSPSSLKSNTTSIREYTRFPTLKHELMVSNNAASSSLFFRPLLSSSSSTPSQQSPSNSPPFDIYTLSIKDNDTAAASPLTEQFNLVEPSFEDQHKSFVTIVEQFLAKVWVDNLPEQSDVQQVLELLKFDYGRQIFGRLLLHGLEENSSKTKLGDALFYCLGDVLKAGLREANLHSDFSATRMYLEASFIYHRLAKGSNEFVSERVRNQDIWQNYMFWEQFFFDSIEQRCKSMYGNIVRELIRWESYPADKQDRLKLEERDMEFSLLSKMVYYMINLGSRPDLVRRFVNKMCSGINFDIERTETMMQVVSNITRARDMYDQDDQDQENGGSSNNLAGEKHVDKDLKMTFKDKDKSFLPIGLHTSKTNEGRELLNHLIDEKSNVVALRSISRIMNLKTAWSEKRTTTSQKIDYRDISENRGDYVVKTFAGHQEGVLCVALLVNHQSSSHKESSVLVTGSADSTLKVWDMTSTKCLGTLEDHGGWVTSVEITSDSRAISGSYDKTLKLWDLNKCAKIKSMRGHKGSISCLQSIDNHQFVSGSYDNTICIWDDRSNKATSSLLGHQQPIMNVLHEGYNIISGSRDTNIRIWDIRTMTCKTILSGHTDWVKCLQYDGGDVLLSGSCDGRVKLWSIENSECIKTLQGHSGSINSILLHNKLESDGNASQRFITASSDTSIRVWDTNYAESYHVLSGHTDEVMGVSKFINNLVVSGSYDGTVKLWDVETGKSQRTIHNHSHRISSLRTYDSIIVTGSWDKTAKVCLFSLDFRS